ncbi:uncharacterized protein PHALS_14047 [Plasmopara halstedii]|uniref:Uncharacterized protein n=1 Tax=Plasmopara halstedii TaxID=4781 RepID=A0A0N7L6A8_PLAHL|nr:uncharacterized protein PHALS_14047 [Plasmopara halstedii]CEG43755.1 hypothetical protein PHALS_14047 [Plasmopara halstedii]|eukprot:XP_024580124.1 hypothetical protein PHALS_14047 [Plasmopara halstedii]
MVMLFEEAILTSFLMQVTTYGTLTIVTIEYAQTFSTSFKQAVTMLLPSILLQSGDRHNESGLTDTSFTITGMLAFY